MSSLLLIHAGATLYMTGLIWFVQLVHYPLMGKVGPDGYAQYQRLHERKTLLAVGPAMLVELITAVLLVIYTPNPIGPASAWIGLGLVVLIWLSTALLQVPCHKKLAAGFDADAHRRLVRTNWLRTILWSARGAIALAVLG